MNATAEAIETPNDAAHRLAASTIAEGYKLEALHEYQTADGTPVYYRIRCRHPDGRKWIRPMRFDGMTYTIGEPPAPKAGKPLYRLPGLIADTTAPVFIVEGEGCADALAGLGIVATTSGSCSSADAADWQPLAGRTATLWPDNDKPGTKYAEAVAAKLLPLGCTVRCVAREVVEALPERGDVVDWITPDTTAADVLALEAVEVRPDTRPAPEPLRRPTPPAAAYPVGELGPILQPACEAIRRAIQAPPAVCAASLLAAASLVTQGLADVHIDGRTYPLSLWLLTVAESGERKSAVDNEAMRAAREVEHALHQQYATATTQHQADMAEWEAKCGAAKTDARTKKGTGLADALQKIGPAPEAPLLPMLTAADFTAEGVAKLLARGRPSIGAFTDEGGLVFGGHAMTKETETRTAATFCKLWDNGMLDRVRSLDGASKLFGKRLAMHLMAQPVIAERALGNELLAGQGFLARCLIAWPDGTAGTRPYLAESVQDTSGMLQFTARMRELLERELPLSEGTANELEPRRLTLDIDAKAAWVKAYNAIERHEAPGERFEVCKPWASKTAEQALRIAGVLRLTEEPDAQTIDAGTMGRALELSLWYLGEAERLAGTAEVPAEIRNAEALLAWCHEGNRQWLHSRQALRLGPNRIRTADTFRNAMQALEATGWAYPVENGMTLEGKHRRHVWEIVPEVEA